LEAIKNEVRKYVKRERNKALPAGSDYWAFNCKFGLVEAEAEPVHVGEITKAMDKAVATGASTGTSVESFYIEILAAASVRQAREDYDDLDE
jgi:hypothetical protein